MIMLKIVNNKACRSVRETITEECFGGEDTRHHPDTFPGIDRALDTCWKAFGNKKCQGWKPWPAPGRVPNPVPQPPPAKKPNGKRWQLPSLQLPDLQLSPQAATWLGVGAVALLILSAGTLAPEEGAAAALLGLGKAAF